MDRIASALERLAVIEETLVARLLQNYERAEKHWALNEEYLACYVTRDAVNEQRAAERHEWERQSQAEAVERRSRLGTISHAMSALRSFGDVGDVGELDKKKDEPPTEEGKAAP